MLKKKKTKKKKSIFLAGVLLLLIFSALPAAAAGQMGSLTIYYYGTTPEEETVVLAGAGFSLYRVGIYSEGEWKLEKGFENAGVSFDDTTASGQKKAAETLEAFIKKENLPAEQTEKTDSSGYARFGEIETGLYLVIPAGDISCGGGTFHAGSFLISIPEGQADGSVLYDVTVEPKSEWASDGDNPENPQPPSEKPSPDKETSHKGESVKTGDDTPVWLFMKILAVSVIVIILLLFGRKRKEEIRSMEESNTEQGDTLLK